MVGCGSSLFRWSSWAAVFSPEAGGVRSPLRLSKPSVGPRPRRPYPKVDVVHLSRLRFPFPPFVGVPTVEGVSSTVRATSSLSMGCVCCRYRRGVRVIDVRSMGGTWALGCRGVWVVGWCGSGWWVVSGLSFVVGSLGDVVPVVGPLLGSLVAVRSLFGATPRSWVTCWVVGRCGSSWCPVFGSSLGSLFIVRSALLFVVGL